MDELDELLIMVDLNEKVSEDARSAVIEIL